MRAADLAARYRRLPPLLVDGALASILLAIDLAAWIPEKPGTCACEQSVPLALAILGLGSVPLAWRRRYPLTVAALSFTALVLHEILGYPEAPILGPLFAIYSLGAYRELRPSAGAAVLLIGVYQAAYASEVIRYGIPVLGIARNLLFVVSLWGLGASVRRTRTYAAELEDKADRLEREREENARHAVAEERARVARELHDIVAHNVSVMVVQAGGARRLLATSPERSAEALGSIEETGRQALVEMRRLLGILRRDDDSLALEPQPGIDELPALAEQMQQAGLPVQLATEGDARPLPAALDLSIYRIVQEALTNTLKHARPARAWVTLRYQGDAVLVEIADDGRGPPPEGAQGDGQGHGLAGMRERVGLFGGDLRAGSRPGGGFRVVARLPIEEGIR